MILHTVNKSPFQSSCLSECLRFCTVDSAVILIEDGVYAAKRGTESARDLLSSKAGNLYALRPDIEARGLLDQLEPSVQLVDDAGFVELCTRYNTVQSWY